MFKRGILGFLLALGLSMMAHTAQGAVIENSMVVTDVTPAQFCVVWGTLEPSTAWVEVFEDAQATIPFAQAVVKAESPDHPPAENIGVMKVKVLGLKPDTEYFFRTQTTLKQTGAIYASPLHRVKTQKASAIVRNDVLVQKVSVGSGNEAPGVLVIASVDGASYPVSGWVGDGVPGQYAAIDTNNFYHAQTRVNLELRGGEVIKLTVFGGSLGSFEIQETIPEETGEMQQLSRAVSFEVAKASSGASGQAAGGGGGCFIAAIIE